MTTLADVQALEERVRETHLRAAVIEESLDRGIFDADAAYRLIDRSLLRYSEDLEPLNVLEAMDALLERRPWLAHPKPPPPPQLGQPGYDPHAANLDRMKTRLRARGLV